MSCIFTLIFVIFPMRIVKKPGFKISIPVSCCNPLTYFVVWRVLKAGTCSKFFAWASGLSKAYIVRVRGSG